MVPISSRWPTFIARAALAGALAATGGLAAAAIVTAPAGVVNGPHNDTPAYDVWQRMDVRATASVGITGDYPRSGDGSVLMTSAHSCNRLARRG